MKRLSAVIALAASLTVLMLTVVAPSPAQAGPTCAGVWHWPPDPCGVVHNRSGGTLQLNRDSSSHLSCVPDGNPLQLRYLPDGFSSNSYGYPRWPDVDCVRSNTRWIVTNGRVYPPGTWIRIWSHKWIYGL